MSIDRVLSTASTEAPHRRQRPGARHAAVTYDPLASRQRLSVPPIASLRGDADVGRSSYSPAGGAPRRGPTSCVGRTMNQQAPLVAGESDPLLAYLLTAAKPDGSRRAL